MPNHLKDRERTKRPQVTAEVRAENVSVQRERLAGALGQLRRLE